MLCFVLLSHILDLLTFHWPCSGLGLHVGIKNYSHAYNRKMSFIFLYRLYSRSLTKKLLRSTVTLAVQVAIIRLAIKQEQRLSVYCYCPLTDASKSLLLYKLLVYSTTNTKMLGFSQNTYGQPISGPLTTTWTISAWLLCKPTQEKTTFRIFGLFLIKLYTVFRKSTYFGMSFRFIVIVLNFLFPSSSLQLGLGLWCPNDKFKDISESRPYKKENIIKKLNKSNGKNPKGFLKAYFPQNLFAYKNVFKRL